MKNYCLYAFEGDCSEGAMSDAADYIPLDNPEMNISLVRLYLRNQLEKQLVDYEYDDPRCTELYREHHDLGNALIAEGVFHHKWHKRTQWVLCEMDEGKPLNIHSEVNKCPFKGSGWKSNGDRA